MQASFMGPIRRFCPDGEHEIAEQLRKRSRSFARQRVLASFD
jgi:hypothetical protein